MEFEVVLLAEGDIKEESRTHARLEYSFFQPYINQLTN